MEIWLIFVLIVINGIFAMSEMSLVSSRKARLQKLAGERRAGAKSALKLHQEPSRFLSTVQVGITLVAILSGALGEDALVKPLYQQFIAIPQIAPYAETTARVLTVIIITYFSVVVGELVPKRLALLSPEAIAIFVARPMNFLAAIGSPIVWLLSSSSTFLLWLLRAHRQPQATITNEEIKLLMEIGSESGVFHASEGKLVNNILKLDEQRVGAIMSPRKDIFVIDLADPDAEVRSKIAHCEYARAVVCENGLENVLGILHLSDLLKTVLNGTDFNIRKSLRPPLYVPDSMSLVQLLEFFRAVHADFALIANEYGETEGLVTLSDVLTAIVGDLPTLESSLDPDVVQRADGSWLVDGGLSIKRLKSVIGANTYFPGEQDNAYNTVSGFILFQLEKIPRVADNFAYGDWYFEVVDIDGIRIDKVLISHKGPVDLEA
ncbi:HlyC/CorC family transporter [Methylomonas paludis]|uniref:HlyC/CorC family transporter n=1 Tax=Methylomonas paludis TaxID=1173101 RepID=A0A975MRI0_9GAMM|nr:hemolysin family protein [Methylomonas paludis]QWF72174.1 HlyC/CorC family transporter [Methylomonas paludis]